MLKNCLSEFVVLLIFLQQQMIQKRSEGAQAKYELKESLQDVATRAASRALESTAVGLTAPKSAYEFEVSWRALSDDSARQMQLLKVCPDIHIHIFTLLSRDL